MSKTTTSEHLHAFHKASHEDRTQAIANCTKALDKASGMEPAGGPTTTFLKAEIARHETMQMHHADGMAQCEKAINDHLNKMVPTAVSGITPNRPDITAVPRNGQPAIPARQRA